MLKYILSFFRSSEVELSLQDATSILTLTQYQQTEDTQEQKKLEEDPKPETEFKSEYNFSTKIGEITGTKGAAFVIDSLYEFTPENEVQKFQIGVRVSYQKLVTEGKIEIYNVNVINNNDWDVELQRDSIASTRVMVCKVDKRKKRYLYLSPGDIKVNLDKVSIEYLPRIGDWLEVEVRYEVNEQAIDLSGDIIEVLRLAPMRPHTKSGRITTWDPVEYCGTINNTIFFNKDCLSCGYVTAVGDQVVAEIIESDQGTCRWRALKVLPKVVNYKSKTLGSDSKIEESHPGLELSDCHLQFDKLGQVTSFTLLLSNKSDQNFEFVAVKQQENSQVLIVRDFSEPHLILPGDVFNLDLICSPRTMGISSEFLELVFKGFSVGKCINISVSPSVNNGWGYSQKSSQSVNYENARYGNKQIIRGPKQGNTRFQTVRLPEYPVPNKLLDLVLKYPDERNKFFLIEELKIVKKCLFTDLNSMNYEEKFHTLLHLDEISGLLHIRQYDQARTCLIPNKEFLMLEVENLAERRPSIVLGDRIMASDPLGRNQEEYEGNIFKVGSKHLYLKFSSMFHAMYKGEDCSIRVIPGRSSYKRRHHAVYLVARNLGQEWLFPTKVEEKPAQVNFVYTPYKSKVLTNSEEREITSTCARRPLTAPELIKKAREAKRKAARERLNRSKQDGSKGDSDGSISSIDGSSVCSEGEKLETEKALKLDWHNTKLNCKQKDAVVNILKGVAKPLPYVIFGPPGTGKTVTVIESILQIVRMIPGCRVLVATPSNSAADLIALRLIDSGVLKPGQLVRFVSINYARNDNIPPMLVPYCATGSTAKDGTADEMTLAQNGMTLDCSRSVLGRHKITVSTCSSTGMLHYMGFPRGHFSHIFVDEAGQASEPEVMIPVSFLDKYDGQVVLAGDPMQLGPVLLSRIASECGLNESFLERLIGRFPYVRDPDGFPESGGYDPRLVTKLLYNYRSLKPILNLFSSMFYHGELISTISDTDSREARVLNLLKEILPSTTTGVVPAVVFHGVAGQNYQTADSPSWYNPYEAAQVFYYVNECLRLGLKSENIGIITPYTKQAREIRQLLREAEFDLPKVGTVEEFQGRESDVVFLSTVRSSTDRVASDLQHSLGFVSSPRRLNVAISRAKILLVIIGNPALLCHDAHWRTVIQYCMEHGAYTGCAFFSS